jgi:hypothetical protein
VKAGFLFGVSIVAFSIVQFVGDGSSRTYSFPFPYIDVAHVQVVVDGVAAGFVFDNTNTVTLNTAAPASSLITISRNTPKGVVPVDFSDGSILREADLDILAVFATYVSQETFDRADASLGFDIADGKWNATSYRIKNVLDPVDPQDAVTKYWSESALTSQLNQATSQAVSAASSAVTATSQATVATTKANTATTKASEASTSATNSAASATQSQGFRDTTQGYKEAAASSASAAASSAVSSASSATAASGSASTAATQAGLATTNGATQVALATTQSGNAASSATASSNSASNAATSATNAASSATTAAGYSPTQSGNSGKFLTTNGTATSWATVDALPDQTGNATKYLTTNGTGPSWDSLDTDANSTTKGLYEMANTIASNYAITSGNNAMSAGPIVVNSGVSVTIPSGSRWTIV